MNIKYSIAAIGYTGWCGLGFVRGINSYKYSHNKYNEKASYLYSDSIVNGISGIFVYAFPFALPITVYKELYRLEVNVRNLEDDKKSSLYNYLI